MLVMLVLIGENLEVLIDRIIFWPVLDVDVIGNEGVRNVWN